MLRENRVDMSKLRPGRRGPLCYSGSQEIIDLINGFFHDIFLPKTMDLAVHTLLPFPSQLNSLLFTVGPLELGKNPLKKEPISIEALCI